MKELYGILKGVSRSFYLSMRFLPVRMREPIGLGYLLARASDTLADAEDVEAEMKREALTLFRERDLGGLRKLVKSEFAIEGMKEKEWLLLQELGSVMRLSDKLDEHCKSEVEKVIDTISLGQLEDVERFEINGGKIDSDDELLDYCYKVAGCVGEFWSEIGVYCDPGFSNRSLEELRVLGKELGVGLQLVNVLRDAPKDLEQGRVYIPGMDTLSLPLAAPWIEHARGCAYEGIKYSDSLSSRMQRMATYLPAALAVETLDLLATASEKQWKNGVKVPRIMVYRELLSGLLRPQLF